MRVLAFRLHKEVPLLSILLQALIMQEANCPLLTTVIIIKAWDLFHMPQVTLLPSPPNK